uniref:NADH-ubiquinone oxidoreductase chain 4 n=1 Tax=Sperchon plumifer TaxID=2047715 RepID=A0A3G1VW95_9ACAR|nr:NADH dehydrogenase subunit 4 [Sperchon plumifer]AYK28787.1 NADH dehydrogenase subunit 4 [Sperchon plumifer]
MGFIFILPFFFFLLINKMVLELFFVLSFIFVYYILSSYLFDYYLFYFDILNWSLLILSVLIISFMLISNLSFSLDFNFGSIFNFNLFLMFLSLLLVFVSSSVIMFYVFFEFSVIPIFFMLCGWGFNFERLQAGFYMLMYTLFFSLPFLIFICLINFNIKTIFILSSYYLYESDFDFFFVFISIFMFLVKLPSYFFHLWLPKAHVEAPVSGSMILAGVLLKLGAYGMLIYVPFVFYNLITFSYYFYFLGLWGGLMACFVCFRQVDLKKLVAFMSISHMGMVLSGVFSFSFISLVGLVFMLLAHGLSSSGLFFSLNCFYERFHSRSLVLIKGSSILLIGLSFWFFILISSNISAPPSFSFFSELSLLIGISFFDLNSLFVFLTIMFIGTVCSFHLYMSVFHGFSHIFYSFEPLNLKEHFILFIHCVPIFVLFVFI